MKVNLECVEPCLSSKEEEERKTEIARVVLRHLAWEKVCPLCQRRKWALVLPSGIMLQP